MAAMQSKFDGVYTSEKKVRILVVKHVEGGRY